MPFVALLVKLSKNVRRLTAGDTAASSPMSGWLSDRVLWGWLAGGSLIALIVCYNLAIQSVVLGSREAGWGYGYLRGFDTRVLVVALLATALAAAWFFS